MEKRKESKGQGAEHAKELFKKAVEEYKLAYEALRDSEKIVEEFETEEYPSDVLAEKYFGLKDHRFVWVDFQELKRYHGLMGVTLPSGMTVTALYDAKIDHRLDMAKDLAEIEGRELVFFKDSEGEDFKHAKEYHAGIEVFVEAEQEIQELKQIYEGARKEIARKEGIDLSECSWEWGKDQTQTKRFCEAQMDPQYRPMLKEIVGKLEEIERIFSK